MKIKLEHPHAKVPTRANNWDCGLDLYSVNVFLLQPGERRLIDTGVAIELPDSYVGYICPRSGLAGKHGISIVNAPGVVDSGFRGTLKVILINLGEEPYFGSVGDKIAQLVIQRCEFPDLEVVEELSGSTRGTNGFGSSGR